LITRGGDGTATKTIRTFGTMTEELLMLADWLTQAGRTHVAMESTGVFWRPVYNLVEGTFELLLANARHSKAVPGRETDVQDGEWIADLLHHGLLQPSFVPDRAQRELRELTRYRMTLVRERTAVANRLQKILEGATITLASVAADILGTSGREILTALVTGETDAVVLAEHATGRLRSKLPDLQRALAGRIGEHQHFMIRQQLAHIDFLETAVAQVSAEVAERVQSEEAARGRHQHGSVCQCPSPGFMGRDLSRQLSQRRQAAEWEDPEREPLAASRAGSGSPCGSTAERHLPRGSICTVRSSAGQEPSCSRCRPQHPDHCLPSA
jgi:hypothetical protein